MFEIVKEFFNKNQVAAIILDAYLVFIVVYVVLRFVLRNKKALNIFIGTIIFIGITLIAINLNLKISKELYTYVSTIYFIGVIVVLAPEIRKFLESSTKDVKLEILSSSDHTKMQVADATMFLASKKIGAIITIEKHNSLDQYAEKAIALNSDISKELLINIFSPLTPLHDGAVIIRGNKIRCAGAYYVLTHQADLDKTTGSRHRAGLGISEVTDSLTVIVSEETGNISIAIEGIMFKIVDKQKLLEYLDMFLK